MLIITNINTLYLADHMQEPARKTRMIFTPTVSKGLLNDCWTNAKSHLTGITCEALVTTIHAASVGKKA